MVKKGNIGEEDIKELKGKIIKNSKRCQFLNKIKMNTYKTKFFAGSRGDCEKWPTGYTESSGHEQCLLHLS
jgi:hypothetical protein